MHYCPQCGSPSLERVSYKEFICQQCQFTYFHNAAAAVMVAIVVNDEVLVAIRGRAPKKVCIIFLADLLTQMKA